MLVDAGSLGYMMLMVGPGIGLAGLLIRYTVRMDHPDAGRPTPAEQT